MAEDQPEIIAAIAAREMQQALLDTEDVDAFLQELATLAVKVLPGDVWCGITLRRDHRPVTVASSDFRASQVDEVQYRHHRGPCLTSVATGESVVIDDLTVDRRWGDYRQEALAHGVRSSLSLPLGTGERTVGAANFYSGEPGAFGPAEQALASRFAGEASGALTLAVRLADRLELSENLRSALGSRAIIDQALGIIMGDRRCRADEAFDILRGMSQHRNVKLRVVAAEIITTVTGRLPAGGTQHS